MKTINDFKMYIHIKWYSYKVSKYKMNKFDKNLLHLSLAYEFLLIGAKDSFNKEVDKIYLNFFNGLLDKIGNKEKLVVLIVVLEELLKVNKFKNNLYVKDIINTIKEDPTPYVVNEIYFTERYKYAFRNLFLDEYLANNNIVILEK